MKKKKTADDADVFIDNLNKYKSISIIGLEKNTGKTTTLNFIMSMLNGKIIGITSIGRDGEEKDVVTLTNKPRIYVNEDTFIATSKYSFLKSDAEFEILNVMDIDTPLGDIVMGRCIYPGFVEIAGASTGKQTKMVIDMLKDYGCEIVVVDGAVSRKTSSNPCVTEASVLCTGTAFSENIDTLVEKTLNVLEVFSFERAEESTVKLYDKNMEHSRIAYVYANSVKRSTLKTSIGASKEIISSFNDDLRFVFLKGILTEGIVKDILDSSLNIKSVTFVIEDPTKFFAGRSSYDAFKKKGGRIQVKNSINIIGVSINPVSPSGCILDGRRILERLRDRTDIPVFNVMDYDWNVIG